MTLPHISDRQKPFIIAAAVLFAVSFFFWLFKMPGRRYVMVFPSADSKRLDMEERYIRRFRGQNSVSSFVDELLLGPETERYRPLFTPGTRAVSCFVRGKILYVNLSPELLEEGGGACSIREGTDLFRKNIHRNFNNIKDIEMFADGRGMYENR